MTSITKKISEGTIFTVTQKILTIILGAFGAILVLQELGAKQYGFVVLAVSIINIFNLFLDLGIGNVVVSDIAGDYGEKNLGKVKKLIKEYSDFQIIAGVLLSLIVFVFSFISHKYYGTEIASLVRMASIIIFLNGLRNIMITVFYGFSKFSFLALFYFLESLVKFLAVFFLVYTLHGGVVSVMLTYLLSPFLAIMIMLPFYFLARLPLRKIEAISGSILFNLIKAHGKFQIFARPLHNSLDPLRYWIIQYFAGVEAVAVYQVALKFFGYLSQIVFSIETPLLSVVSEELRRDKQLVKKIIERVSKYFTLIAVLAMILSFIFTPFFLHLFFQEKYDGSIPLIKWFLLSFIIGGISILMRPMLFALKAQKELLKADFFSAVITYPIASYLTYLYGPAGFAAPIGAYLTFAFRYYYLKKLEPIFSINFYSFFKWDKEDYFLIKKIFNGFMNKTVNRIFKA